MAAKQKINEMSYQLSGWSLGSHSLSALALLHSSAGLLLRGTVPVVVLPAAWGAVEWLLVWWGCLRVAVGSVEV